VVPHHPSLRLGGDQGRRYAYLRRKARDWEEIGRRMEARIREALARWAEGKADAECEGLGKKIEEKVKRKLRDWLKEE
jgi:hypothetical protein